MNIILNGDCTKHNAGLLLAEEIGPLSARSVINISQKPNTVVTKSFLDALFNKVLHKYFYSYIFSFDHTVSPITKTEIRKAVLSIVPTATFTEKKNTSDCDFHLYFLNRTSGSNPALRLRTVKPVPEGTMVAVVGQFSTGKKRAIFNAGAVNWQTENDVLSTATLLDIGVLLTGVEEVEFVPIQEGENLSGYICKDDITPVDYVHSSFKSKYKRTFIIKGIK